MGDQFIVGYHLQVRPLIQNGFREDTASAGIRPVKRPSIYPFAASTWFSIRRCLADFALLISLVRV